MFKEFRQYMCDFETTVFSGQTFTEVWAAAIAEINGDYVDVFHSIDEFFNAVFHLKGNVMLYFHNLKFDGTFILPYLVRLGFKQAYEDDRFLKPRQMPNKTYSVIISDLGMWYKITIKQNRRIIEIRDSLKLLPFSVKAIGDAFKTKHRKGVIEYTGVRYAGCDITPEERDYIINDVLVVKEALEFMFESGHTRLTIASCCLAEFKTLWRPDVYEYLFPNLYDVSLDKSIYGYDNAFDYIHAGYKGGWCYLKPDRANTLINGGITLDVNSLYPSVMHSRSGSIYPIGLPTFWRGDIPPEALRPDTYYYVRFKCRFYLKPQHLPFVQIKNSRFYLGNECLETSDIITRGQRSPYYINADGVLVENKVILTMTMTDYALFREHYHVVGLEVLDGCYFEAYHNIFDGYINKYYRIKQASTGARRTLAKLFLNSLYGKTAASRVSNFKVPIESDDDVIGYATVKAEDKAPGYIPIGAAITSYARNFTIRAAQANFKHFVYSDTDSLHLNCKPGQTRGVEIDDSELLKWKLEGEWDTGLFVRQKTYLEVTGDNIDVKCAGMPEASKLEFINKVKTGELQLTDFKRGLVVGGKLIPKHIKGGTILCETTYELK